MFHVKHLRHTTSEHAVIETERFVYSPFRLVIYMCIVRNALTLKYAQANTSLQYAMCGVSTTIR